ncbi:hypothetical protein BC936DRAFT_143564 [Jimgerdemannia flammicorona]|uniref:Uncharacterized protein n=1 Tax=Jimgerdemannia flammicorona TaxID=994334 RepID=A0A433DDR0_9FUNG|nr:hypothetical protein BC936DRAFT_143564 [Jimgerdemannia flammicorona]
MLVSLMITWASTFPRWLRLPSTRPLYPRSFSQVTWWSFSTVGILPFEIKMARFLQSNHSHKYGTHKKPEQATPCVRSMTRSCYARSDSSLSCKVEGSSQGFWSVDCEGEEHLLYRGKRKRTLKYFIFLFFGEGEEGL